MQRRSECGFDGILSWRNGLSSRRDGLESLTPDQRAQTLALDSCQHLRENEIGIGGGRNTAFTERNVDSRHELYPDTRVRHIASNDRNAPTPQHNTGIIWRRPVAITKSSNGDRLTGCQAKHHRRHRHSAASPPPPPFLPRCSNVAPVSSPPPLLFLAYVAVP